VGWTDACAFERDHAKVQRLRRCVAVTEVLGCIEERRKCGLPILHWFTGSKSELEFAKRLDCWFSVGPQMLLTTVGMNRVSSMPCDRILLEIDGPFGKVNDQILKPAAVQQAIGTLAEIWRISAEDAKLQIEHNQQAIWRFAGLKIP
jgi:TatD DNase family protein